MECTNTIYQRSSPLLTNFVGTITIHLQNSNKSESLKRAICGQIKVPR